VGETALADAQSYELRELTAEEKRHYYEHGWVHLKGVLPPALLRGLRASLLQELGAAIWPWSINAFMSHDGLFDFLLYSPLGHLASQLFGGEAYLFSDFLYFRHAGQLITPIHVDSGECENPMAPANITATSRLRTWVTLDDDVPAPVLLDQSVWKELLRGEADRAAYWRGEYAGKGFHELFVERYGTWANPELVEHIVAPQNVSLGDVLLHSPCLLHMSPVSDSDRLLGFLCPTFQPADARRFVYPYASPEQARRNCRNDLGHRELTVGHDCFPRVYPHSDHLRHKDMQFQYASAEGMGTRFHWYKLWVGRRFADLMSWDVSQSPPYRPPTASFQALKGASGWIALNLGWGFH